MPPRASPVLPAPFLPPTPTEEGQVRKTQKTKIKKSKIKHNKVKQSKTQFKFRPSTHSPAKEKNPQTPARFFSCETAFFFLIHRERPLWFGCLEKRFFCLNGKWYLCGKKCSARKVTLPLGSNLRVHSVASRRAPFHPRQFTRFVYR